MIFLNAQGNILLKNGSVMKGGECCCGKYVLGFFCNLEICTENWNDWEENGLVRDFPSDPFSGEDGVIYAIPAERAWNGCFNGRRMMVIDAYYELRDQFGNVTNRPSLAVSRTLKYHLVMDTVNHLAFDSERSALAHLEQYRRDLFLLARDSCHACYSPGFGYPDFITWAEEPHNRCTLRFGADTAVELKLESVAGTNPLNVNNLERKIWIRLDPESGLYGGEYKNPDEVPADSPEWKTFADADENCVCPEMNFSRSLSYQSDILEKDGESVEYRMSVKLIFGTERDRVSSNLLRPESRTVPYRGPFLNRAELTVLKDRTGMEDGRERTETETFSAVLLNATECCLLIEPDQDASSGFAFPFSFDDLQLANPFQDFSGQITGETDTIGQLEDLIPPPDWLAAYGIPKDERWGLVTSGAYRASREVRGDVDQITISGFRYDRTKSTGDSYCNGAGMDSEFDPFLPEEFE